MQHVSPDLNYHRIDDDPTKSRAPHIHRHFNFNRFDLVRAASSYAVRGVRAAAMVAESCGRHRRAVFTDRRLSQASTAGDSDPAGCGFFSEHRHSLEPQHVGVILALSQRGIDYQTGAACFRIGDEEIDTSAVHDAGDIRSSDTMCLIPSGRVDPDMGTIDWRSPAGRWSLILPYY